MNKQDWIWVAIRIFGIYLIVLSIINLPNLLAFAYQALPFKTTTTLMVSESGMDAEGCINLAEQMRLSTIGSFLISLLKVFIYAGLGIYFVRDGKFIFRLVYNDEQQNESES